MSKDLEDIRLSLLKIQNQICNSINLPFKTLNQPQENGISIWSTNASLETNYFYLDNSQEPCRYYQCISEPQNANQLFNRLDLLWDEPNYGRYKDNIFSRVRQSQIKVFKNCYKKLEVNFTNIPNIEQISKTVEIGNEKSAITLNIRGEQLFTVQSGILDWKMVMNYISILQHTNVITASIFILPLEFMARLIGNTGQLDASEEKIANSLQKNYDDIKSQLEQNIFNYQYIIAPIKIKERYSCIIIQGCNSFSKYSKNTNILLFNPKSQTTGLFVSALRIMLKTQYTDRKKQSLAVTNALVPDICLMLPRSISKSDSSIYLLLYIQFLFIHDCRQMRKLRLTQNRRKLHLFPRSLALDMRSMIWNLFAKLIQVPSSEQKSTLCHQLIQNQLRYFDRSVKQFDYDKFEGRQLIKYQILDKRKGQCNESARFQNELNYYADSKINYELSFDQ